MMGARAGEALAFWPSLAANLIAGTIRQTNVQTQTVSPSSSLTDVTFHYYFVNEE